MDFISRSFRLERGSSLKHNLGRSNSSLLASELVSSEISRFTAYEKLSESMRLTGESTVYRRRRNKAWSFLTKVFSFNKTDRGDVIGREGANHPPRTAAARERNSRRSSWIPDPNRRWPQGWWSESLICLHRQLICFVSMKLGGFILNLGQIRFFFICYFVASLLINCMSLFVVPILSFLNLLQVCRYSVLFQQHLPL